MPNATQRDEKAAENPFAALQDAGFGSMVGMTQVWVDAMGSLSAEVLSFAATRLQEDVKTQQAMMHCKNLKELQHVQAQFFQKAVDQYQMETGKLVEMGSTLFATDQDES